jgi:hypothetical protein
VRSKNLDFLITVEGELARPPAPVQPPRSASLDAIIEALEKLQLHASEAHASEGNQLLDFNYGWLKHQLTIFLGP